MKFNSAFKTGKNVILGKNVKIGDGTTVYDNVTIGDNAVIANDCIIGEPQNDYYHNPGYVNPPTHIGRDSLIRSHAVIYAGSTFGNNLSTGHRVTIREGTIMGEHCSVGTLCDIQGEAFFGDYCRLHSNAHICQYSTIGNFVFIYPYVVFTNDPTPPSNTYKGPTVGDYSIVSTGSLLMPGVKIGSNAMVGAGSIVTRNVDDFTLAFGSPAKTIRDIRDIKSREDADKSHYPWMHHFDRGMPWKDRAFAAWEKQHRKKSAKRPS